MSQEPRIRAATAVLAALLAIASAACARDAARSTGSRPEGVPTMPASGIVERAVDGDTIVVRSGRVTGRVRIIGIDTPEIGARRACHGIAAHLELDHALAGRRVSLTPQAEPVDRYGRWLADVRAVDGPWSGSDVARRLLHGGHARSMPIAPNTRNATELARIEAAARARGAGLWGRCGEARAFPGARAR